jgi:transposase-like protein
LQTGEGELRIEIPQVRDALPFVSRFFPYWPTKRLVRTEPLKALIVGGFVRGMSTRDVESLCEEAGLGNISKSTVSRVCAELHERFRAFCRRSLYDINLVVLFLDAIYLPVRPSGPREGVVCAWGIDEHGHRQLVSVRLGMRGSKEDWLELGRDLTSRGLAAPRLVVAGGAPGLIEAVDELWPHADPQPAPGWSTFRFLKLAPFSVPVDRRALSGLCARRRVLRASVTRRPNPVS